MYNYTADPPLSWICTSWFHLWVENCGNPHASQCRSSHSVTDAPA